MPPTDTNIYPGQHNKCVENVERGPIDIVAVETRRTWRGGLDRIYRINRIGGGGGVRVVPLVPVVPFFLPRTGPGRPRERRGNFNSVEFFQFR